MKTRSNPLLAQEGLPSYGLITMEDIREALTFLNAWVPEKIEVLKKSQNFKEFQRLWNELDSRMDFIWDSFLHLHQTMNSEELRKIYKEWAPRMSALWTEIQQDAHIYRILKKFWEDHSFPISESRWLEKKLLEFRHRGGDLEPDQKAQFLQWDEELQQAYGEFSHHLLDATKKIIHVSYDSKDLEGMSFSYRERASSLYGKNSSPEGGPWAFSLEYMSYAPYLEQGPSRELRKILYEAYTQKASHGDLDNTPVIRKILILLRKKAQILGYPHYGAMSLAEKMVKNEKTFLDFWNKVMETTLAKAKIERAKLESFGAKVGFPEVEPWDVAYLTEKKAEEEFHYSSEEFKSYLSLDTALKALFSHIRETFDVECIQEKSSKEVSWHEDVLVYGVYENGKRLASIFFDPYGRPEGKLSGAWMMPAYGYGDGQCLPLAAHVITNFSPPSLGEGGQPSLLSFKDYLTLFHEWGHALQHVLSRVETYGISGIMGIEQDAVEWASQFLEHGAHRKDLLMGFARHWKTDEPISEKICQGVLKRAKYQNSMEDLRQMLLAWIDWNIYSALDPEKEDIWEFQDRILAPYKHVSYLPYVNRLLCSTIHFFGGGYAAGYYSYKWAEVLSEDTQKAFREADPAKVMDLGKKLRETLLALGGSVEPGQVFQKFRGRDPDLQALLERISL